MSNAVFAMMAATIAFLALYPAIFTTVLAELFAQVPLLENALPAGLARSTASVNGKPELFYHLGGNGPWIPKVSGTVEGGVQPPEGCHVTQVHMVSPSKRHLLMIDTLISHFHSCHGTPNGIPQLQQRAVRKRLQHSAAVCAADRRSRNVVTLQQDARR